MTSSIVENKKGDQTKNKMSSPKCRFCNEKLNDVFVDLGMSPLSNSYLKARDLDKPETFFPLKTLVCSSCFLVQLREYESPDAIFTDYAYFSSYSDMWMEHARQYTNMVIDRFDIEKDSLVVELASNDGYLLSNFLEKDIPVLGIEPAENVAEVSKQKGIPTLIEFFGREFAKDLAEKNKTADLLVANNVLAHVPDINSFVSGIKIILKPDGVATLEFPHLLNLIRQNQFDTIYHEHFSYISFLTVSSIFEKHGMKIFDVEEIPTHGGSLRIYATHQNNKYQVKESVEVLHQKESAAGLDNISTYHNFSEGIRKLKRDILQTLIRIKNEKKQVVGYGAAAKGNTLLNYCGIREDMIDYVVDRNPHKVGKFLPGTHIPIKPVEKIKSDKPDYLFILPWNLKDEIITQNKFIREWGGKFIIPIPDIQIIN